MMQPNFKQPRIRNEKHRRFIASLPCLVCRVGGLSQCAHIGVAGLGKKIGDDESVPLCCARPDIEGCHAKQHRLGHAKFWLPYGGVEKAKTLALKLYEHTGNWERGCELIVKFR